MSKPGRFESKRAILLAWRVRKIRNITGQWPEHKRAKLRTFPSGKADTASRFQSKRSRRSCITMCPCCLRVQVKELPILPGSLSGAVKEAFRLYSGFLQGSGTMGAQRFALVECSQG
ncbi:hypothetical protein COLO4_00630 [Corchorus olitorius]|uniref:Uncharacterized protein n=1 Tax=Corchorus olitorius TaxID=93759 RepID=A0A1R3L3L6_9ROSI|nr:hypothetical protein COLO4_00630 [Corchorus olitorius]